MHHKSYTLPGSWLSPGKRIVKSLVSLPDHWYALTDKNIYFSGRSGNLPHRFVPLIYTFPNGTIANVFGKKMSILADTCYTVAGNHLWKIHKNWVGHDFLDIPASANIVLPVAPNDIYIGTSQGIWHNNHKLPYLAHEFISLILRTATTLIFCTENGVYTLPFENRERGSGLRQLTDKPCCYAQEHSGYLFLRTTDGLSVYEQGSNHIVSELIPTRYTVPFTIRGFTVNKTHVAVVGSKGVFYIPLENFLSQVSYIPKIHVINSQTGPAPAGTSYTSVYNKKLSISLSLDILDNNASNFPVYYRLLRQRQPLFNWRNTNNNNVILTALAPGSYQIEYLVKYSPGKNGVIIRYNIIIQPRWWQTIWFKLGLFVFFILMTATVLWLYLRQLKQRHRLALKRQLHLYELESRKLYAQMNPHFMFNSIGVAHSLVETGEQEKALSYLSGFARLMRNILYNSTEDVISIAHETEVLRQYLQLQMLRLKQGFKYSITIDPGIDAEHTYLPPMMLQPFVENAIEHGIRPLPGEGLVTITISPSDDQCIQCIITDNGYGINPQQNKPEERRSLAIKITKERLQIIAEEKNCDAGVTILPLYPDSTPNGTKVILKIPVQYD